MTSLFHLAQCTQCLIMLKHMSECTPFLRWNKIPLYIHTPRFAYPFIHVGCFDYLASTSNVMNIRVQIFLQDSSLNSFEYVPRSRIAGLYNFFFLFFEELPSTTLVSSVAVPFYSSINKAQ